MGEKTIVFEESLMNNLIKNKDNILSAICPSPDKKMSIVAKPYQWGEKDSYYVLNKDLDAVVKKDYKEYYYGISPKLNASIIKNAVCCINCALEDDKAKEFIEEKVGFSDLESFIKKYHDYFMLPCKEIKYEEGDTKEKSSADYLKVFALYSTICLFNIYGISIKLQEGFDIKKYGVQYKEEDGSVSIRGLITKELYEDLREKNYRKNEKGFFVMGEGDLDFKEIYNIDNIKIIGQDLFYSGCLLKVKKIIHNKDNVANVDTDSYKIEFERTSFATVYTMITKYVNHCFISKDDEKLIKEFFINEDKHCNKCLQNINKESDKEKICDAVNDYLENSFNVMQIGVTGMLETKDGYYVLCKRGDKVFDSHKYYPSVNGNAEIDDENVELYQNSVNEDCPTINLDDSRIDFLGEINREAYAELKTIFDERAWDTAGFCIAGNNRYISINSKSESKYFKEERRIQLNIIFKQKTDKTLTELRGLQKKAVEKYEADNLSGIRIKVYKRWSVFLLDKVKQLLTFIYSLKDIVTTSVTGIAVFFLSQKITGIEKTVSFIFAMILLALSIPKLFNRLITYAKTIKNTKSYNVIKGWHVCFWHSEKWVKENVLDWTLYRQDIKDEIENNNENKGKTLKEAYRDYRWNKVKNCLKKKHEIQSCKFHPVTACAVSIALNEKMKEEKSGIIESIKKVCDNHKKKKQQMSKIIKEKE